MQDQRGNWHAGAMATLIDDVGASAIYSAVGQIKVSVDFNVSYISTVKIQVHFLFIYYFLLLSLFSTYERHPESHKFSLLCYLTPKKNKKTSSS